MYFPFLRSYQNEVLAVRDLAAMLAGTGNVRPVFEPVRDRVNDFVTIANAGLRILIIENPSRGPFATGLPVSFGTAFATANIVPTLRVDAATTPNNIVTYRPGEAIAIFLEQPVLPAVRVAISNRNPDVVLTNEGISPIGMVPRARAAEISDPFNKERTNADYLNHANELYSGRYSSIKTDPAFEHFGDHSIQGNVLSSEDDIPGAYRAALHHIYISGAVGSPLWIRHYVSTNFTDTRQNVGLKFLDALSQLVGDLPGYYAFNALNDTSTCDEYRARDAADQSSNLGYAKKLGIKHHLELMSRIV